MGQQGKLRRLVCVGPSYHYSRLYNTYVDDCGLPEDLDQ